MDAEGVLEVAAALNLRAGRPYNGRRWGPQVSLACPLAPWSHDDPDDYNKSCSVSIDPDGPSFARCWSFNCSYKGSFLNLVQSAIRRRPDADRFEELLKWLLENDKDDIEVRARKASIRIDERWSSVNDAVRLAGKGIPPVHDHDVLDESRLTSFKGKVPKYALERGLDVECCRTWELGFDKEALRLVFPVRDFAGRLIGMTGRILPSAEARAGILGQDVTKYHNYSGLAKSRHIYGAWMWKKERPLVLVEGPIDAARVWMALRNFQYNVGATLGQGFTTTHRRIVAASWPTGVYIFGDDDRAGRMMAEKIHDALKALCPTYIVRCPRETRVDEETGEALPVSRDPGELTDDEIRKAVFDGELILDRIDW